jgi:sarcosine oxidase subunit gamma
VIIAEPHYAIAQLMARRGTGALLAKRMKSSLDIDLPGAGRATASADLRALSIGPGAWLVMAPRQKDRELTGVLEKVVGDAASVAAQTHGKVTLAISGPAARDCLGKGCRVDLHPRVFSPGHVAVTPIGHISTVVTEIEPTGSYELIMASSLSVSFLEWLEASAEEYGYEVV